MVLKLEKMLLLIPLVAALLVIQSSTSSPIQNELLKDLMIRLSRLEMKKIEQGKKILSLRGTIDAHLKSNHSVQPSRDKHVISSSITEYNQMSSIGKIGKSSPGDFSARAALPSSCTDLSLIGHSLNGLYLVQNTATNKIETVYCNFGTSVLEEVVGTVDVKSKNVHFYVQRNTRLSVYYAIIPFEIERLNEGGAFDLLSGIFTTPVPGIYHFEFSGVQDAAALYVTIFLQVNGVNVGCAYSFDRYNSDNPTLSASLRLAANDTVNLYNDGFGFISDNNNHMTHFTGWLVDEDIIQIVF